MEDAVSVKKEKAEKKGGKDGMEKAGDGELSVIYFWIRGKCLRRVKGFVAVRRKRSGL